MTWKYRKLAVLTILWLGTSYMGNLLQAMDCGIPVSARMISSIFHYIWITTIHGFVDIRVVLAVWTYRINYFSNLLFWRPNQTQENGADYSLKTE